jgi:hypothetical protein
MASQSRQETFSRTCWITFQERGTTSSVSVTSSPSLDSCAPPQRGQQAGAAITTRSRGRCSGKGLREGRLRLKPATVVVLAAAASAISSSSVAEASSSSSCSSIWSSSRRLRSECGPNRSWFSFWICSLRWAISASLLTARASAALARASAPANAASSVATRSARAREPASMTRMESQNPRLEAPQTGG